MKTPNRTTAGALNRYLNGQLLADSASCDGRICSLGCYRLSRVVDSFLVPVTPEPLITCTVKGSPEFRERDVGGA